jgi:succinyl-CoA synthetase beta subunit
MPWTIERKHNHVAVVTMNTNKVNAQNPAFFGDLHAGAVARRVQEGGSLVPFRQA